MRLNFRHRCANTSRPTTGRPATPARLVVSSERAGGARHSPFNVKNQETTDNQQEKTMDESKARMAAGIMPGNMGGETLREYCGLSRRRVKRSSRTIEESIGISAQRLVIAVRRHREKAGAAQDK